MVNIDSVRRLLAIADASKDAYAVADVAGAILTENRADAHAAAHYARALEAMKLSAASHRLLGTTSPAATGLIPWASRARRFAANLAALEGRSPEAAALVQAAMEQLPRYELHGSVDGNYQVLDTMQPFPDAWLGALVNHKSAERLWQFDRAQTPMPNPVLFDGLGYGWLFLHVLRTTERSLVDYSCAVYAVERDPLALAMLFHMHDLPHIISQPRVRWLVKSSEAEALQAFKDLMDRDANCSIPTIFAQCSLHAHPPLPVRELAEQIAAERLEAQQPLVAAAKVHYAGKDVAYWRQRFEEAVTGEGPPLRVLGITSRYTTVLRHSIAEMQQAVNAAGHEMRIAMESDDHSLEHPCLQMIVDFKPDLIFQISRLRYENPLLPQEIPFVCWDQDNLPCMRTPEASAHLNPLTYIAGHAAVYGHTFLNWPTSSLIFCQPAGATFRYPGVPLPAETLARYTCDISFISNASTAPEELRNEQRHRWQNAPHAAAIYDHVSSLVLNQADAGASWEYWSLRRAIQDFASVNGPGLTPAAEKEMILALTTLSDRCFRHAALQWVVRWCEKAGRSLRLYGRGWDAHPVYSRYAAGYAGQGPELTAIHQASKINLHLMESGGFLHSRALDGLVAGGFFLTRTSPNDGFHPQHAPAQITLAERAEALCLSTLGDLDACKDPAVIRAWSVMRHFFADLNPHDRISSLILWKELPTACVLFPQLSSISFSTGAEFETLADHYLADDTARKTIALDMRNIVRQELSYARRWVQFLSAVRQGLRQGAADSHAQPLSEASVLAPAGCPG